jgi:hypothetical protein
LGAVAELEKLMQKSDKEKEKMLQDALKRTKPSLAVEEAPKKTKVKHQEPSKE